MDHLAPISLSTIDGQIGRVVWGLPIRLFMTYLITIKFFAKNNVTLLCRKTEQNWTRVQEEQKSR